MEGKNNYFGTISLILGVIAIITIFCCIGIIPAIISLIFGFICLTQKPEGGQKKMAMIGIVLSLIAFIVIYIIGIIVILNGSDQNEALQNIKPIQQSEPKIPEQQKVPEQKVEEIKKEEVKVPESSLEEKLKNITKKTLGEKTNYDAPIFVKGYEENGVLYLKLNANDNLTNNFIVSGVFKDAKDIYKELFKNFNYKEITIEWQFPFLDEYGNNVMDNIAITTLTKDDADKINWNNITTDKFKLLTMDYLSPLF